MKNIKDIMKQTIERNEKLVLISMSNLDKFKDYSKVFDILFIKDEITLKKEIRKEKIKQLKNN